MEELHNPTMEKRRTVAALLATAALLVAGALLIWLAVQSTEERMRDSLLRQASLAGRSLDVQSLRNLKGDRSDLETPQFSRLESMLASLRSIDPLYRSIYLIGRERNPVDDGPEGGLFYLVDGDRPGNPGHSEPGKPFGGSIDRVNGVFRNRVATIDGLHYHDGELRVTAYVPISDRRGPLAGLATPEQAREIVKRAIAYYRERGRDALLKTLNDPEGDFSSADLYAFAYDTSMTMLAHPIRPELVGQNLLHRKDWAGGKYFRMEMRDAALNSGSGWVDYEYENPANRQLEPKTTYVERVGNLIVCAGAYKGTGAALAVLGIDVDASDWRSEILKATFPPVLLTLLLGAILWAWVLVRMRRNTLPRRLVANMGVLCTAAAGLVMTVYAVYYAHRDESAHRAESFAELVAGKTDGIASALTGIADFELEGLANYIHTIPQVEVKEFEHYVKDLISSPLVMAWEWAPKVDASCRSAFERTIPSGMIWEYDEAGTRVRAGLREVYHPVVRCAPYKGNERETGFDLSSEPERRKAMDKAVETGLTTVSEPLRLVHNSLSQQGMVLFKPVNESAAGKCAEGFLTAVVGFGTLLNSTAPEGAPPMELFLLREDREPLLLADTLGAAGAGASYKATRPFGAVGRVFAVTAYADASFMETNPNRLGLITGAAGFLLTLAIALMVNSAARRRTELETLVHSRTGELRRSEERHRAMFEKTLAVQLLIDPETGLLVNVNRSAEEFYGYPRAKLLTMHVWELNALTEEEVRSAMRSALNQGRRLFNFRHRLADGSVRDVEVHTAPIPQGESIVLYSIVHDVTDRLRIEREVAESREMLDLILNSAAEAIYGTDTEGRCTFCNRACVEMLGYSSAEELLGRNMHEVIHHTKADGSPCLEEDCFILNSNREGHGSHRDDEILWRRNRTAFPAEYWSYPQFKNGRVVGGVVTFIDITERRRAERSLLETNQHLETATLRANELAAEAELANQAKSDFLANMSHEIRTPMNGVIGMTGLLLDTELSDEQRRYAMLVKESGESLLTLINDILDFSKIEAGRMELEKIDFSLDALLDDFAATLALKAFDKGLEFTCSADSGVPTKLTGDPGRLRQVLTNLVGNAIKFTSVGEVAVRVSLEEETGGDGVLLRFTIRDTGIGISREKLGLLFHKFTQADASTTRKYGGTGLGLAISKQLVELLGGTIGVKSDLGSGSEFWFTASFNRRTGPGVMESRAPAELTGVRILVVDDNATNREIMAKRFDSWGMRPEEAPDGPSALGMLKAAVAEEDPFLLAVIDMQMPEMDGQALGRLIKAEPDLAALRMIMLTSMGRRGDARRVAEAGFSGYLNKPARLGELEKVLSLALGSPAPAPGTPESKAILTRYAEKESREPFFGMKARILLAEDNPTNQLVAMGLLRKLGLRADAVQDGVQALRVLEAIPYDLVLMDVQMPTMDGMEATKRIRMKGSKVLNPDVPVIAMTARARTQDREECLAAGMSDYVPKPIDPDELASVLAKWLPGKPQDFSERPPQVAAIMKMTAPPVDAPVWDRADMESRMMGDQGLVEIICEAFLLDMPAQLEKLAAYLKAGDAPGAERQAHTIKGASANLGGERLRGIAYEMEKAAKQGDLDAVEALMPSLKENFGELRAVIENRKNNSEAGTVQ